MIDITNKSETLRTALARAEIKAGANSIKEIENNKVPKGNVFASAKISGLLAVKNTSNVLPHCHPLPVEFADISFKIKNRNIIEISVEVKTIYKTGCEMEALHGASVAALTVYDMLKPIDGNIEIRNINLLKKSGGKSDNKNFYPDHNLTAAIIVISDSVYNDKSADRSGKYLKGKLKGLDLQLRSFLIVPDDIKMIQDNINSCVKKNIDLIITTGGTGLSKRDVTYEAVSPLLDNEIKGVMESARSYGQKRTPFAMLSRGVAGFIEDTLLLTFPGSVNGVKEYLDSLFPYVLHLFKVRKNFRH